MINRLLSRQTLSRVFAQTRGARFSTTGGEKENKEEQKSPENAAVEEAVQNENIKPPKLLPFEFEPFKFGYEREQLAYGFSIEELYGIRYGFKHSESVKREIRKDTLTGIILSIILFGFYFRTRELNFQQQKDWQKYVTHDLTYVRPIPDRIQ